MWLTLFLGSVVLLTLTKLLWPRHGDLHRLPGPSLLFTVREALAGRMDVTKIHHLLRDLPKTYGPVCKLPDVTGRPNVVVNDPDLIHEVLVRSGKSMAGRINVFRAEGIFGHTGILQNLEPDERWKQLRKLTHGHLRQYGDGLNDLQTLLMDIAEDMFAEFGAAGKAPIDPHDTIYQTALKTILFLLSGHRPFSDDPIVAVLQQMDDLSRQALSPVAGASFQILDAFPWIRHLGISSAWTVIKELNALEDKLIRMVREKYEESPETQSLYKRFMDVLDGDNKQSLIREHDMRKTITALLVAGAATTTDTMYALINLLAHHQEIQDKMSAEIGKNVPKGEPVSIDHRVKLPYCRAVLLEMFRYHTAVPTNAPRSSINGKIGDYNIPTGTHVLTNLWHLHHDPDFWSEPYKFVPERFLDEAGELLAVDHPNRRRLMPFGAGIRVCIAEIMATVRLFLWLTNLVQRFRVEPAADNDRSLVEAENYVCASLLVSRPYKVHFERRA